MSKLTIIDDINARLRASGLDEYEAIEILGTGTWGLVVKALHKPLQRYVAIKFIQHALADDDSAVPRFMREAQLLAGLQNPHVVRVYSFGQLVDGGLYLCMEYVRGTHLGHLIKSGLLADPVEFKKVFLQIAEALCVLHANEIVHRDLKPENVLVSDDAVVKIIDFGLAKPAVSEQKLTTAGDSVGTPEYMSPEQCRGKELDVRSDIYSLGCSMYHAFTQTLPYDGQTPYHTMKLHLVGSPRVPHEVRKDGLFYEDLELVILRTLARDPKDRYQNPGELLEALQNASVTTAVPGDDLKKDGRNKPSLLHLSAVCGLLVLAGIVAVFLFPSFFGKTEKTNLPVSEIGIEDIRRRMVAIPPLEPRQTEESNELVALVDQKLAVRPNAYTYGLKGRLLAIGGRYEEALAAFDKAVAGGNSEVNLVRGDCWAHLGNLPKALDEFQHTKRKYAGLVRASQVCRDAGLMKESIRYADEAIAVGSVADQINGYCNRAFNQIKAGEQKEAIKSAQHALTITQSVFTAEYDHVLPNVTLGCAYCEDGQEASGRRLLAESLHNFEDKTYELYRICIQPGAKTYLKRSDQVFQQELRKHLSGASPPQ